MKWLLIVVLAVVVVVVLRMAGASRTPEQPAGTVKKRYCMQCRQIVPDGTVVCSGCGCRSFARE